MYVCVDATLYCEQVKWTTVPDKLKKFIRHIFTTTISKLTKGLLKIFIIFFVSTLRTIFLKCVFHSKTFINKHNLKLMQQFKRFLDSKRID